MVLQLQHNYNISCLFCFPTEIRNEVLAIEKNNTFFSQPRNINILSYDIYEIMYICTVRMGYSNNGNLKRQYIHSLYLF